MANGDVTLPRARLEAMARQCLALREQADSLATLIQSELVANAPVDPREKSQQPPATFGRRSA